MRAKRENDFLDDVVILGAGHAGLTAGYALSKSGQQVLMVERDATVGGLAKTITHHGFRFDLGGHRFITEDKNIERLVREILDDRLLLVPRSSKILLNGKYFDYPLQPMNAFLGLGLPMTVRIFFDYLTEQLKRNYKPTRIVSLEDWVVQHFGRTLFNIFFKDYSKKLWGIDSRHIAMEWVERRIQGLSMGTALKDALFKLQDKGMRTLASQFLYPPRGIGEIAEGFRRAIERNSRILTKTSIERINRVGYRIQNIELKNGVRTYVQPGSQFLSSIPMTTLVKLLHPRPPPDVLHATLRLRYRDLVIVAVMIDRERVTDQTWIYTPDKGIPFARIHEPTNWSTKMAPPGKTLLVTEHFCFCGDSVWGAGDESLAESTITHLSHLGIVKQHEVTNAVVLRIPKAYPLFEVGYSEYSETIRDYLDRFSNLRLLGRAGLFRYDNMDQAMASGLAAAEELLALHPEAQTQAPLTASGVQP